jgi:hypothetical protein
MSQARPRELRPRFFMQISAGRISRGEILALSQFPEDRFPEDDSIFVVSNEK